jgi:hypothetical protein
MLSISVLVSDGSAFRNAFSAKVTVTCLNDAPLVSDIPDQTITRGEQFDILNLGMYVEDNETPDSLMSWTVVGASKYSVTIKTPVSADIKKWGNIGLYLNPSDGGFIIDTYGEPQDLKYLNH